MATHSGDPAVNNFGARLCEAVSRRTKERCRLPAMGGWLGSGLCRHHGGKTPKVIAQTERRKAEAERRKFLEESGFFNPDVEALEDPVTTFAIHASRVLWQAEFLGAQINASSDCECCGRVELDPHLLRELRATSKELGMVLDSMIRHGLYTRALDLEAAKYAAVYKGLDMVLYRLMGTQYNDSHMRVAEKIFRETVDPILKQIEAKK